jgi:two-component system cell cycle response regulator
MNEKILIIDDNNLNISILTDILKNESFAVFSADNGLSVLEMAHRLQPDVILLDIIMPIMDGFEVCKLLKSDHELKDIPVIMVTARTEGNDIKNAFEIGAFDYIKKPIDEIEVVARIKSALRLKKRHEKLVELSMKDGLTGLYNYTLLMELFEKEIAKQQRISMDISFVMVDIDCFKKINDTYGHVFGNIILKELSNILINSVRKGDIVARYGGEEFGIVLPQTNIQDAFQLCERIRKKIEKFNFNIRSETVRITVSMGVFSKDHRSNSTVNEIILEADDKLYKAKQNGRNRVEIN